MIRVRAEIVKRDLCRLHGGEVIKEEKGFDFPVIIISITLDLVQILEEFFLSKNVSLLVWERE